MKKQQKFPEPIQTPATKATEGHDEDISEEEILDKKIVTPEQWALIREKAMELFQRGTRVAAEQGLILVDTKYEMGYYKGRSEEHTSELQSRGHLVCRLLLEKKKTTTHRI